MLEIPVVYVIFNRPQPTAKTFQRIREAQPTRLFLVSDAARHDRPGEAEQVAESRHIAEQVDWDCDVYKIYAAKNMGCGARISSAITEAFQSVDRLIVLEDDCLAEPTFFSFCHQLLDRYQHDQRVMHISGNNFQLGRQRTDASYYFSKYAHCWGWATWRRAWKKFDLRASAWPAFRDQGHLASVCDNAREVAYWSEMYDRVYEGQSQSWAFPWSLTCWMNHGLSILPSVNLVSNIGFDQQATHTNRKSPVEALPTEPIHQMIHPSHVHRHVEADRFTDQLVFSGAGRKGPIKRIEKAIRSLRKAG